jgi:hypothetical protein
MKKKIIILGCIFLLVGACSNESEDSNKINQKISTLQNENQILEHKIEAIELSNEISDLKNIPQYKFARLTSDTKDYGVLNTESGKFVVCIDNITPYLDGYRLNLLLGNLNATAFSNVTLKINYFVKENDMPILKSVETTTTRNILPGMWNKVELIVPNVKAEDIRMFDVSLETPQLLLRRDYRY